MSESPFLESLGRVEHFDKAMAGADWGQVFGRQAGSMVRQSPEHWFTVLR